MPQAILQWRGVPLYMTFTHTLFAIHNGHENCKHYHKMQIPFVHKAFFGYKDVQKYKISGSWKKTASLVSCQNWLRIIWPLSVYKPRSFWQLTTRTNILGQQWYVKGYFIAWTIFIWWEWQRALYHKRSLCVTLSDKMRRWSTSMGEHFKFLKCQCWELTRHLQAAARCRGVTVWGTTKKSTHCMVYISIVFLYTKFPR